MIDRRRFLASLGASVAALAHTPAALRNLLRARKLERIGLQLYTVRDAMKRDVAGTLARVAAIGYREVEFAGYFGKTPAEIRALLSTNNLTAPSTHVGFETIGADWRRTLDDAKGIGAQWVTVAWIPEKQRGDLDEWKHIAAKFNKAGAEAKSAGLRFAYHNHNFEFKRIGAKGPLPYDVLLAHTDPAHVDFEMDLYWAVMAGADPLAYFAKHPGRFKMVHVKDSAGPPEHKMMDVGGGTIDFKNIFAHSDQAGIRHYFVEHDEPKDPFASIEASYKYLSQLEF